MDYLDAYQAAGGELPTSVELSEDVEGVRLMTLYQAKGLEFPIVFVPSLLDGEWPVKEQGGGSFPRELLREAVPAGDIHTDEERRLLYVAMTRAKSTLQLVRPLRFFVRQQQRHGDRHVIAPLTRFIPEKLFAHFQRVTIHDPTIAVGDGQADTGAVRFDVGAKLRALWAG